MEFLPSGQHRGSADGAKSETAADRKETAELKIENCAGIAKLTYSSNTKQKEYKMNLIGKDYLLYKRQKEQRQRKRLINFVFTVAVIAILYFLAHLIYYIK